MTSKLGNKKYNSASSVNDRGANRLRKALITGAVALFLLGGIILLYIFLPMVSSKSETSALIKIPVNANRELVKDTLSKYFGEKFAGNVILISKIRKHEFANRHGAYLLEQGITPLQAERKLTSGGQQPINIVINGQRGINNLADKVTDRLDVDADSLILFLKNPDNIKDYNLKPEEVLALFVDDTYQFYWSASPKTIIEKIGANYKKIWNESRMNKAKALGLTPQEVITIASIVDEETNKQDEKPLISRLYINRLKKGMKLQADPTVKFALGDFSLKRIRKDHLEANSPYNTYKITGLPPGPIRTVNVKDIDAVLDAPQHDYLYMCAKEDFSGYHNFAKDFASHQQNARKYQRALNLRNIK